MNMSCSTKMIKYLMFAFNLFFVISGIIIIAVGAAAKTVYSDYSAFLNDKYFSLPNMLIATGVFIFFISFFGCCGAIKESWIMLGVFSIFLCIIFIFEFSAGIAGYVLRDKTLSYLDGTLRANMKNYKNESHEIWDLIQSSFHCCGVDSYTDWNTTFSTEYELPISCCPQMSGTTNVFYCNSFIITTPGITASITSSPTTESPITESPKTESPKTESPITESPKTESPITESPKTESPITESPKTEEPSSSPDTPIRKREVGDETPDASSTVSTSTPNRTTTGPYNTGCKEAFGSYIKKHAVQIGGCALGLAIVQILGIIFSCHLVRQLKNGYYST